MSDTLFKQVNYTLGSLVEFIGLGHIGLPDLQRPFVWKKPKVRDLFDSMYRGYPIGYFLFWQNGLVEGVRTIGTDQKQKPAAAWSLPGFGCRHQEGQAFLPNITDVLKSTADIFAIVDGYLEGLSSSRPRVRA